MHRATLAGIIALALFLAMLLMLSTVHPGIASLQLTFSGERFQAVVMAWSAEQRMSVLRHFYLDFPCLLFYGCFGYLQSRVILARHHPGKILAILLRGALPAAAVFDVMENLIHISVLQNLIVNPMDWLFFLSGVSASVKSVLLAAFFVLWFVIARRGHRISQQKAG